jgi:hypothetical protein
VTAALGLEDEREINALLHRYTRAASTGDADAFADCFTTDGVLESYLGEQVKGRSELAAYIGRIHGGIAERGTTIRLWLDNVLCAASAEGADCSAFCLTFESAAGEAPRPIFSGTYEDRLVRLDGLCWLEFRVGK